MAAFVQTGISANALTGRSLPGVTGRVPENLRKWQVALSKMRVTGRRPRLLCIGTSKMMGAGAGTDALNVATTGAAARNLPRRLADRLGTRGLPCNYAPICGANGMSSAAIFSAYDPRVSFGTGWAIQSGIWTSAAGFVFGTTGGSTDPLSLTFAGTIDRIEIAYYRGGGVGEFEVRDNGAIVATIDARGSPNALASQVVPLTRGAGKTITLTRTTKYANEVYVSRLLPFDSLTPAVDVINAGWFGSRSADWINASWPWAPLNAIAPMAPDLTLIGLGANDMSAEGNVPLATFAANLQLIIDKAKLTGDVVLLVETFGQVPEWGSAATQEAYRQAIISLGAANDCMVVDLASRFGTHAAANALGLFFDGIHENSVAADDEAEMVAAALVL